MNINAVENLLNKYASGECTGLVFRMQSGIHCIVGVTDVDDVRSPDSVTLSKHDMTLVLSFSHNTSGIHRTSVVYDCGCLESVVVCTDSAKDPEQRAKVVIQD